MNWPAIRARILDTITQAARIDVVWRDREQPFVRPQDTTPKEYGAIAKLHAFGVNTIATEFRQDLNGLSNKLDLTQAEQGRFTVSCLIEAYDQADSKQALEYTER